MLCIFGACLDFGVCQFIMCFKPSAIWCVRAVAMSILRPLLSFLLLAWQVLYNMLNWMHCVIASALGLILSISWFLLEVLVSRFTCAVYGFCWIMLFMYLFLDSWVWNLVLPVGFIKLILEVLGYLQSLL